MIMNLILMVLIIHLDFTYSNVKTQLNEKSIIKEDFIDKLTDSESILFIIIEFVLDTIDDYNDTKKKSFFYILLTLTSFRFNKYYSIIKSKLNIQPNTFESKIIDGFEEGKLLLSGIF